jgi:hypothetical protein
LIDCGCTYLFSTGKVVKSIGHEVLQRPVELARLHGTWPQLLFSKSYVDEVNAGQSDLFRGLTRKTRSTLIIVSTGEHGLVRAATILGSA